MWWVAKDSNLHLIASKATALSSYAKVPYGCGGGIRTHDYHRMKVLRTTAPLLRNMVALLGIEPSHMVCNTNALTDELKGYKLLMWSAMQELNLPHLHIRQRFCH